MRVLRPFSSGAGAGVLCVLLVAVCTLLGWLRGVERGTYDALFRARGIRYPHPSVMLIVVDDASVSGEDRWPLSRRTYAKLVDTLNRGGARTVAFDFIFSTPSDSRLADAAFAAACRRSGRVVQGAAFYVPAETSPTQIVTRRADRRPLPARFALSNNGSALPTLNRAAAWVSSAEPQLRDVMPATGHVNVYPEWDGALRRVPHVIAYRGALYPSLALAAAMHWNGGKPHEIEVGPNNFLFDGNRRAPLDENGESYVNWIGGNRSFPTFSLRDILTGRVPPETFKDKLVFVGATAAGTFEHRPTPFSPSQPGVEMQANAADDLLSGRALHAASPLWTWLVALAFAVLIGAMATSRRAVAGAIFSVVACAILWQIAVWLLARDWYFPVATPLLSALLTYGAATALNFRREWRANWRADVAISLLARSASLMAARLDRSGARAVVETAAREVLSARAAHIAFDDEPGAMGELARLLGEERQGVLWPRPEHKAQNKNLATPRDTLDTLLERAYESLDLPRGTLRTLVAAPLPSLAREWDETARPIESRGVLLIAGRDGARAGNFSVRDVALAESLARQAGLALANAAYEARLRSRVQSANRELRDAYAVLETQSTRLAAAAEAIDDALVVTDSQGRATFINHAANRILLGAAPRLGDDVRATLRAHQLAPIAALWDKLGAAQGAAQGEERVLGEAVREIARESDHEETAPDEIEAQSVRSILSAQLARLDDANESGGAMLLVSDVTAQRELDTMKNDFVAFVAHELRTPLTSMIGFAQLLGRSNSAFSDEERRDMINRIVMRGERLNRMISELLDVSRLDAGKPLLLRYAMLDVTALCEHIVEAQRVALPDPDEYFLYVDTADAVEIEADADRIEQIITNLVSNAVKYSPDGGKVRVGIEEAETDISLSVSDSGMGMTAEQQSRLFAKYYRTSDALESGIKGTGLGLFLVKQLVEAHGGNIAVKSERGQGTTFTVVVPRHRPQESTVEFDRTR